MVTKSATQAVTRAGSTPDTSGQRKGVLGHEGPWKGRGGEGKGRALNVESGVQRGKGQGR